jgi:PAS domain S-box-containing protein
MSLRRALILAAFTVLYFGAGRLGLSLAFVNESASAIWPPTGLAIAACLLGGPWFWPAILAGAFLVNLTTTVAVFPSMLIACGNTAEALIAATLVRRVVRGPDIFAKTSSILAYVAAALLASAVAATIGIAALLGGGLAEPATATMIWLTWLTGDFSSAVLLTPAIVTWTQARERPWTARTGLEACALLATVIIAGYWVFGPTVPGIRSYPLMFVMLPVLLWAALRFGLVGATSTVLVTAGVATLGTLNGYGPFSRGTANESLLLLQAYLAVKMVVMLTLAAAVAARHRAEHDIRQLNLDLERRIQERAEDLQRLHGRLVEAQHVAHIGSWEWDVAANSIWWSDEMYRVHGLTVGSPITYQRFLSAVHPDDRARVQEIVGTSASTGDAFTFEHRAVKPDGTVVTLYSRGRVVMGEDGRAIRMLGIGHDITERKRAEEERLELVHEQAARREAEESNRMKDYFLATLSHELRTPLNALIGWTQVLKKSTLDDGLRDKATEAIQRNVTIQAQLVSDILDVARIRSGAVSIEAQPTSIKTIIEGALDIMRPVIAEKQIEVVANLPDGAIVMGDARRLQQVCWNMLSNSAKFLDRGGFIAIAARLDGDAVELTIEDNGPGIPEDFLPYAFDQFRQADPTVTRQHGGLGLGLAISRDLVQLHGGTITAANRAQGGAVFTVRLPAATTQTTAGS